MRLLKFCLGIFDFILNTIFEREEFFWSYLNWLKAKLGAFKSSLVL